MPSLKTDTITFRIGSEAKEVCREILADYNMSVSDYCRLAFEYLIQTGRPAVQSKIVSDAELAAMTAQRKKAQEKAREEKSAIEQKNQALLSELKKSLADL